MKRERATGGAPGSPRWAPIVCKKSLNPSGPQGHRSPMYARLKEPNPYDVCLSNLTPRPRAGFRAEGEGRRWMGGG
jgi:hypothetical protein